MAVKTLLVCVTFFIPFKVEIGVYKNGGGTIAFSTCLLSSPKLFNLKAFLLFVIIEPWMTYGLKIQDFTSSSFRYFRFFVREA